MKYSNTILGTIIAVLGLGLVAIVIIPTASVSQQGLFLGLIVLVVNTLLGTRQSEANGHRITAVETVAATNTNRMDNADLPTVPAAAGVAPVDPVDEAA